MLTKTNQSYDLVLISVVIFLAICGVAMVASTSLPIAMERFSNPYLYLFRHLTNLSLSLLLLIMVMTVPTEHWQKNAPLLYFISLILCILVLTFGLKVNGSRRWFSILGFSFQVSEIAKFSLLLYISDFLSRRKDELDTFSQLMPLLVSVAVMMGVIIVEPDLGSVVVMMYILFSTLWISSVPKKYILFLFSCGSVFIFSMVLIAPYRFIRLTTFMDPWAHRFDSGYQLTQSIMAFTRGGWTGTGYGTSMTKLFYLPESHTDFLFAVLAEEWGVLGATSIILAFLIIILRSLYHSMKQFEAGNYFESYLIFGWSQWVFVQVIINIGATTGLLPTKGLTLPFLSYGGTSLLIHSVAFGIILRILYHSMRDNIYE